MFDLYTVYTLTAPKGTISETGVNLIVALIREQKLQEGEWKALNPKNTYFNLPQLPQDWQWVWVVTGRGEYVGTMPKRVSKFYHQQGFKCPASFLTQIGNIARQHSEDQIAYRFEFVDRLDWNAGDFGDGGSCLWGSNARGREVMQDNDVMAVRFYDDSGEGKARAWLYEIGDSRYIVWNGYGFHNDPTLTIARVVSMFLNLSYRRIFLENNGRESGLVYINSGRGYVIGAPEAIEGMADYDFGFETPFACEACGREIDGDDIYWEPEGESGYCESCYYERYDSCAHCGETYERESLTYIESQHEDVCEYCLERHYTHCEGCDGYFPNSDVHEHEGAWYCEECFPETAPPDEE